MQRSIFLAAWLAAAAVGCITETSQPGSSGEEPVAKDEAAIRAGEVDTASRGVVGVLALDRNTICSGVVVAPRVVVTARHCVAAMAPTRDTVDCTRTTFGATSKASDVMVTTARDGAVPVYRHAVKRVLVPRENGFCGSDVAVLVLAHPLEPDDAEVVPLRLERSPSPGEVFSAIGIGRTANEPSGTRHRRDGLLVTCVGTSCGTGLVDSREWWGDGAVCEGDSGGPALDAEGRVVGIASRKRDGCTATIYADVASSEEFLRAALDEAERTPGGNGCSTADDPTTFVPIALAIGAIVVKRRRFTGRRGGGAIEPKSDP